MNEKTNVGKTITSWAEACVLPVLPSFQVTFLWVMTYHSKKGKTVVVLFGIFAMLLTNKQTNAGKNDIIKVFCIYSTIYNKTYFTEVYSSVIGIEAEISI